MANGSVIRTSTPQAATATPQAGIAMQQLLETALQATEAAPTAQAQQWRLAWIKKVRNWLKKEGKEYLSATYGTEEAVIRMQLIEGALANMEREINEAGKGGFKAPDATPLFGMTKTPEELLAEVAENAELKKAMVEAENWYRNYSALLDVLPYYIVRQNGLHGNKIVPQSLREEFLVRFRVNALKMLAPAVFAKTSPQNPVPSNVTDAVILMDFVDKTIHEIYQDVIRSGVQNNNEIAERVKERLQNIANNPERLLEYAAKFFAEYTNIAIETEKQTAEKAVTPSAGSEVSETDIRETDIYVLSTRKNQQLVDLIKEMIKPEQLAITNERGEVKRTVLASRSATDVLNLIFGRLSKRKGIKDIQAAVEGKERVNIFFLSSEKKMVLKNIRDASQFLGNAFQALHQFAKDGFDNVTVSAFVRNMYNAWFPATANKTRTYGLHSMQMVGVLDDKGMTIDLGNIVAAIPKLLTRDIWETAVSNGWFRVFMDEHQRVDIQNNQRQIIGQGGSFRLSRINGLLVSLGAVVVPDENGNIVDGAGKKYSVRLIDEIWNSKRDVNQIRSIMNLSGIKGEPKDFSLVQIATKFVSGEKRAPLRTLGKLETQAPDAELKAEVVSQITKALNMVGLMNRIFIDNNGYLGIDVDALDKEIKEMQKVQKGKRTPAVLTAMQKLRQMLVDTTESNRETEKKQQTKQSADTEEKTKKKYQIERLVDASNKQRRVVLLDEQKVYSREYNSLLNAIYELSLSSLQSGAVNAVLETFTLAAQNERANITQIGRGVSAAFGIQEAPDNGEIVLIKKATQTGEGVAMGTVMGTVTENVTGAVMRTATETATGTTMETTTETVENAEEKEKKRIGALREAKGKSRRILTKSMTSIFSSVTGTEQHAPHQAQACNWVMVRLIAGRKLNVSPAL